MQISRLRVGNEDFLVSSMIERCPKTMMLRELVKNALEAAGNAASGARAVEIAPALVDGQRKLSIWNTGPGMNAEELYRMCDIASSIGKQNALDQNFGMGAKVASLPSNQHGIRYRSCKAGRVHQVVMGKRDAVYGRLRQTGPDGAPADVLDVTDRAIADGRRTDADWTEVVLLGNSAEQDTVADPYAGNPKMPANWIATELYARFYTMPPDIKVMLRGACSTEGGDRDFAPVGERMRDFAQYEAVPTEQGVTLHYFYDAADPDRVGRLLSARGALQPAQSTCALVYRGEIYDMRTPGGWMNEAPVYGFPFGARHFSVYIQLPDDFPLLPDGYRQFLRHAGNLQANIVAREFAMLVLSHRPGWVLELLRSFSPDAQHTQQLQSEMAGLFRLLGVTRRWWPPGKAKPKQEKQEGGEYKPEYEVAPQIVPLRDPGDVRERGMEHKAARFYPETHQLFINTGYPAFTVFRGQLEQEFATHEDQEAVRRASLLVTEQLLIRQICRKLVFGLSKRGTWKPWEVDQSTSMYSLSLAAEDHAGLYEEGRAQVRRQLPEQEGQGAALDPLKASP